jgi:hypothetical protein
MKIPMKIRVALALAAASLLSACSDADWSHGMSFVGLDESASATATTPDPVPQAMAQTAPRPVAAAQTAQANGPNPFCAAVARQDTEGHGFDAATQQGVYVRSYQQCVTVFGNVEAQ